MKKLLVCSDGSHYAEHCCRYGAWLARQTQASVSVLYVTDLRQFEVPAVADLSGSLGIQPYEGMVSHLREVENKKSEFVREHAMKVFEEEGVADRTTFYHETGLLVDVVDDYAEKADLVLLGKRGENVNFATEHLGSMLERVVRSSKKPCLVTNRKFHPIANVAVAYDGSESSHKALEFMGANELFGGMDLHVITAVEGSKEDLAAQRLREAESALKQHGLYPACQMLRGEVETVIAEYVRKKGVDLLIAGAYGHSRIRELLIGSTTTQLLRQCHVPVLCFR